MFAYCQYKDAIGEGLGHKWGNWTGTLAKSNTALKNPKTDETLSAADILKMFEEQNKLTSQELKEGDDWCSMSDDEWDSARFAERVIEAFEQ